MDVLEKRKPFKCNEPAWAEKILKVFGYAALALLLLSTVISLSGQEQMIHEMFITAFNVSWPFFGTALLCFIALKLMGEIKPTWEIMKSCWNGEPE